MEIPTGLNTCYYWRIFIRIHCLERCHIRILWASSSQWLHLYLSVYVMCIIVSHILKGPLNVNVGKQQHHPVTVHLRIRLTLNWTSLCWKNLHRSLQFTSIETHSYLCVLFNGLVFQLLTFTCCTLTCSFICKSDSVKPALACANL